MLRRLVPRLSLVPAAAAILLSGCAVEPPGRTAEEGQAETPGITRASPAGSPSGKVQIPRDRPLRAGFLVVEGVYNTELMAPYDVFQHTLYHVGEGQEIQVFTVAPTADPVTSFEGLRLLPHFSFADAPEMDILVVPSARGSMDTDLENQELIEWVRQTGEKALFVVSLCEGAFVLAKAGLLDGHACTTFPGDYQRFTQLFPHLDLRVNVSFVHHGKFLTSEGGVRSYDVAMYLVDLLYGPEVARGVGRGLLIPWPPGPGTSPSFISDPAYLR